MASPDLENITVEKFVIISWCYSSLNTSLVVVHYMSLATSTLMDYSHTRRPLSGTGPCPRNGYSS